MQEKWVGKIPGEGNGYPLQYSCLPNNVKACSPTTHDQRLFRVTSWQRTRTACHPCPIPRWRANTKATLGCLEQSLAEAIGPGFLLPATSSFPHQPQSHFLDLFLGNGNPLQYACLGNPMDRGARWALVHGAAKSQRQLTEWLNNNTYEFYPTGVDYFWNCFNLHLWNNGKLFSFYTTQIITSLGNKTTAHKLWYSCDLSIMPKTTL